LGLGALDLTEVRPSAPEGLNLGQIKYIQLYTQLVKYAVKQ